MSRAFLLLLLLALLLAAPSAAADGERRPPVRLEQLRACRTPEQVRDLLGRPDHVARQIFYQGYLEQWVYEGALPCRLVILYRLGRKPQIQTVRTPTTAGR